MQSRTKSKMLVGTVLFGIGGLWMGYNALAAPSEFPPDVFAPWNGTWRGEFTAYDIAGNKRYSIDVTQEYETIGDGQQKGVFTTKFADGKVETIHAVNLIRNGKLICRVVKIGRNGKPVGEAKEHNGTYIGPGHIVWYSQLGDHGFETFNERVEGDMYTIHGAGVKTGNPRETEIFEGIYRRVKE